MPKIIKNFGKQGFATMFNCHFMDKRLSYGAVGMLSNVLSLPDGWEFSVKGFMGMHSDGERAVTSLIFELEWFGYLERIQVRDTKGKVVDYLYEFFNESQLPEKNDPVPGWKNRKQFAIKRVQIIDAETGDVISNSVKENPYLQNADTGENPTEKPYLQNADVDNADVDNADVDNAVQLNTNELNTNESSNLSIYLSDVDRPLIVSDKDKMMDGLIDNKLVEEIKKQIDYDVLSEDSILHQGISGEELNAVVDAIAVLKTANQPMQFGESTYSPDVIRQRADSIDASHIEYVFECFEQQHEKVHNVRKYLITALFHAPSTISSYYANRVRADGVVRTRN